jgi:hypothetical protein
MLTRARIIVRITRRTGLMATGVAAVTVGSSAMDNAPAAAACDRACLVEQAKQFNANMVARASRGRTRCATPLREPRRRTRYSGAAFVTRERGPAR